jgi:DNA-directed RNA polymerase specialized sigma24 family protein
LPPFPLDEEGLDPCSAVAILSWRRSSRGAWSTLTEPLREAVVAVNVVGLSYPDNANALGVKEGTIMSGVRLSRSQIAEALEGAASDLSPME